MSNRRDIPLTGITQLEQYVQGVLSGEIPVCKDVMLTVLRHVKDMEAADSDEFEYYFNVDAALHVIEYFRYLRHWKGQWAGKVIQLEPWQVFILGSLFGWLHKETQTRRFREALIMVPRKNGKTTMLAGIGLYLMDYDNEPGAEIYSAATGRNQARIVFDDAYNMVYANEKLRREMSLRKNTIFSTRNNSKFTPLSKESKNLDGLNTHGGLLDELHAWKTRDLYDVIDTSTGSRTQPLMCSISTAGDNREGICFELLDYLKKVISGVITDDRFFGINYTIDKEDEAKWDTEEMWRKANPNYGISVNPADMEALATKARNSEAKKNDFKTKRLDMWISSYSSWMDMDGWKRCEQEVSITEFIGRPCYIAVDLSSKLDLASYSLLFVKDGRPHVFCRHYLPEKTIDDNLIGKRSMYKAWHTSGWITTSAGERIDQDQILEDIIEDCKQFDVQVVGYDPFQMTGIEQKLQKLGVEVMEIGQTVKNLSEPSKELEAMVVSNGITFQSDPVLRWAVSNVVVRYDKKDNIFPTKEGKDNKIDPAISTIMTIALNLLKPLKTRKKRKPRVHSL